MPQTAVTTVASAANWEWVYPIAGTAGLTGLGWCITRLILYFGGLRKDLNHLHGCMERRIGGNENDPPISQQIAVMVAQNDLRRMEVDRRLEELTRKQDETLTLMRDWHAFFSQRMERRSAELFRERPHDST